MDYQHTQTAPLHFVFYPIAAVALAAAWWYRDDSTIFILSLGLTVTFLVVAATFNSLRVLDEGDCLAIRYGPLPLFCKRIPYSAITSVERSRSSFIDGWGIHYVPGRGTTYNIWGFDCAKLTLSQKVIRIGSDDVENLVCFLRTKIGQSNGVSA